MKIVHVGEYVKGGVATHIRNVLSYQKKNPEVDDVYLILSKYNSESNFLLDEDKIIYLPYKRKIASIFVSMFKLKKEVDKIGPDIVHVHSSFAGLMVRFPLLFIKKTPKIVYTPHGWAFNMDVSKFKRMLYAFIERILSLKTDKIINISENEDKVAKEYKISNVKLKTIYNGIDFPNGNHFNSIPVNTFKDKINILFIGRFDKSKGIDILLSFFSNIENKSVMLYLIGESVLDDTSIHIPSNVINIGWVDNELIDSYIKLFDAIIIPSRWEGFGLVALEAMRNRRAIIASNRGALPELVRQGFNGYIFDLDNLSTLNEILNNINKKELIVLGENGYDFYKENFTSENMNQQIISLYKDLL